MALIDVSPEAEQDVAMTALARKQQSYNGAQGNSAPLLVRVRSVTSHGPHINCYTVVDPAGSELPSFEPGSHIDISVPGGKLGVRQYSLCGDPLDRSHYSFAVQREQNGRGGSNAIFEQLKPGVDISVSAPRNKFPLCTSARHHLLLAGGIGITPMISMLHSLRRAGDNFTLHYCTRSRDRTAFLDVLEPLIAERRVFLHWDDGDPTKGLDLKEALRVNEPGTHLYYCGPPGFMAAVATASAHWPAEAVHREYFTPSVNDPGIEAGRGDETGGTTDLFGPAFQVKIASTGQLLDIPSDRTMLHVLREHGFEIDTQCELGVCGTCRTRYLEGEADHRDFVLELEEHEREITVCCSRAKSRLLVLDL